MPFDLAERPVKVGDELLVIVSSDDARPWLGQWYSLRRLDPETLLDGGYEPGDPVLSVPGRTSSARHRVHGLGTVRRLLGYDADVEVRPAGR